VVACAYSATEFVAWIAGQRPPAQWLNMDLSGYMARSDSPSGRPTEPSLVPECPERQGPSAMDLGATNPKGAVTSGLRGPCVTNAGGEVM